MGDISDDMIERYGYPPEESQGARPEDYLGMTDDELRKETAAARDPRVIGIRRWEVLSRLQRWCLAKWCADRDNRA